MPAAYNQSGIYDYTFYIIILNIVKWNAHEKVQNKKSENCNCIIKIQKHLETWDL